MEAKGYLTGLCLRILLLSWVSCCYTSDVSPGQTAYMGDLWGNLLMSNIASDNFVQFEKTKTAQVDHHEECIALCITTPGCAAFAVENKCGPPPWLCALHIKQELVTSYNPHKQNGMFRKEIETAEEIEAAFYHPRERTYHLITGNSVVQYADWEHFVKGYITNKTHSSLVFTSWGHTMDDIILRPLYDITKDLIFAYAFKHDMVYKYLHLEKESLPFRKHFHKHDGERIPGKFGGHVPNEIDAVLDIRLCTPPCDTADLGQNGTFYKTYFFKGDMIHEAWSQTWMTWNAGISYNISSLQNTMFPGVPTHLTAALKVNGTDTEVILFKGLDHWHYDLLSKQLTYLGTVKLCAI